jgi:glycosyltransferase involved in cell wall biosynthesis
MQKRISILFIIDGLNAGGKERQLVEILKGIDKSRFKLGVVTFNNNQHYTKQVALYADYFRFINKRPTRLEPFFCIWKCYNEFNPDIVHTWDSLSSFYSYIPSKYFRAKILDGSIRDAGIEKGWQKKFKLFFIKRANFVIANSFAGLYAYKVEGSVIYNAIDQDRFLLEKNTHEINLIMVANFTGYKDHQTFLRAAIQLLKERVIDNVYLLGDGPLREKYIVWLEKEYPTIRQRFIFPGSVLNVEEYLAKCSIGVLCSTIEYAEGLSNSVLEYMAAGLIAIVTNLGGSREIIEHGKNGFLINPGNPDEIVDIVKMVKENTNLADVLRNNALETLKEKFGHTKNIKLLENIYLKLKRN